MLRLMNPKTPVSYHINKKNKKTRINKCVGF